MRRSIFIIIIFFVLFGSSTAIRGLANTHKTQSIDLIYTYVFHLVVSYQSASGQISSIREREFLQNFFREEAGLSQAQNQNLKNVAYTFVNAYKKVPKKQRSKLSLNAKIELEELFGEKEFRRFDQFVRTKIAPSIIVIKTSESLTFFGTATISVNPTFHELRGVAGISFTDNISANNIAPCSVNATMTGPNVSLNGSDSADCDNRLPNVTLISTAYVNNSQYCITGNYVIDGQSSMLTRCVVTPDIARITSVTLEQIDTNDLPIDSNPNTGGGSRIFPDDKIINDPVERRKIRVRARSSQIQAGTRIYFLSYDLDDPFTNDMPIDPNVNSGFDNNGNVDGLPDTGRGKFSIPAGSSGCEIFELGISCVTNSSGETVVDFTVTRQPGDNFAVAASTEAFYLGGIEVDGINLKDQNNMQIPATTTTSNACVASSSRACRTDMLTVWRRLHLEVDSMGAIQNNFVEGTIALDKKVGNFDTIVFLNVSQALEPGRFQGGRLVVGTGNTRRVFRVKDNQGAGDSVTIRPQDGRPINIHANESFTLYDDDDFNDDDVAKLDGDTGEDILEPDMSLLTTDSSDPNENALAPAYIKPVYDIVNTRNNNTFALNLPGDSCTEIRSLFGDWDSNTANTNIRFWSVYILGAYQGELDQDGDGNDSTSNTDTRGIVDAITNVPKLTCPDTEGSGALIFLELHRLREFPGYNSDRTNPKSMAVTVAHEIGHLFSSTHGDGEIMGTTNGIPLSNKFSDESLDKIRRIAHP
jgi:hypothetical protein